MTLSRNALASVLACLVAAQPALADPTPYFRMRPNALPSLPAAPEAERDGVVQGTGDLRVAGPILVRARIGVPFVLPFSASNAEGAVSWSSVGGGLPPGLSLSPEGVLSGTPAGAATASGIMLRGTDGAGKVGTTQPFTIDARPVPSVAMAASTPARAGSAVRLVPAVAGLYGSKGWAVAEGALPVGLSLDPATGVVSGTALQGGSFPGIVIQVTDSDGAIGRSNPFSVTVASSLVIDGVEDAYRARTGRPMASIRPYVTGASGSLLWSMATGTPDLPPGLALDGYSGTVSGTPSVAGRATGLSLLVRDASTQDLTASRPFSMAIADAPSVAVDALYEGRTGRALSAVPRSTGILAGGRWFVDGALPEGTVLDTATGTISGTVTGGAEGLRLRVVDLFDGAQATSQPFSIRSWPNLAIGAPGIPDAAAGQALAMDPPSVLGLRGTGTLSLAGTLPKGLGFDPSTGVVSGIPEIPGTYPGLSYGVTDSRDGARASSEPFRLVVAGPAGTGAFSVSGVAASYTVETGKPFVLTPTASGGRGAVTWAFGGAFSSWMATDPATGRLSGTPTAPAVSGPLTFVATDGTGATASSVPFTVSSVPPEGPGLSMASFSAILGRQGTGPSPTASGLRTPLSFALASGALPSGLALDPSSGLVAGAPGVVGDFDGIVLRATDASGRTAVSAPFAVAVLAPQDAPAAGTNDGPTGGSTGAGGTGSGSGGSSGTGGGYSGGSSGGSTGGGGAGSGGYAGGSTGGGGYASGGTFSQPPEAVVQRSVYAYMGPGLYGTTGQGFAASPAWSGLTPPLTWTMASGTLPAWATLDAATGAIGGTPTGGVILDGLSLLVRDSAGLAAKTNAFFVSVSDLPVPRASMASPLRGWVGLPFTATPATSGSSGGLTWRLADGQLPQGLTLDAISGTVSGTPGTVSQATGLSLSVTDASGAGASTNAFSIKVTNGPSASVADAATRVGAAFALTPAVSDATGTQAWTLVAGTLPAGLALDAASGAITGRATAVGTRSGIVLRVRDASGLSGSTNAFSISVGVGPAIAGLAASYGGRVGSPLPTPGLSVTNARGTVTWSATGLPPGLALTGSGLTGTPAVAGTYDVTVTATDAYDGAAATGVTSLVVAPLLSVTASPPDLAAHVGQAYATQAPTVEGRRGTALQWTLDSGALPQGATLDGATGVISSTSAPAIAGYPGIRLAARDPVDDATARTQAFAVSVVGAPGIVEDVTSYTARFGSPLTTSPPRMVNAVGAVTWSWGTGTPPAWARVDGGTGSILGTPNVLATTAGLSIVARDSTGATASTVPFSLKVYSAPTVTLSPATATYTLRVGDAFSVTPQANGVAGTVSWGLETAGTMPTGLTQDPATGRVYGTVTGAGDATLTIVSTDSADGAKGRATQVRVTVRPALTVSGLASAYATRVNAFVATGQPQVVGGQGVLTYALSPSVPAGMTFDNPTRGVLSGIPTAARAKATHAVTVTDSADGKTATAPFDLAIYDALALANPGTVTGTANNSFGQVLSTPTGVSGTPTYGITVNGTRNDTALSACGIAFDTTTGMGTSSALKGCSLTGVQVTVRDDNAAFPALSGSAVSPSFPVSIAAAPFYVQIDQSAMTVSAGTTSQMYATVNKTAGTGTIKGTVTWTVVGDDGGTSNVPSWAARDAANCNNDANSGGCLVKFSPPAGAAQGTYPQGGGAWRVRVVDTTGFAAYSTPFTVSVVPKVSAATVRPASAVYGGGPVSNTQRCTGCTSITVAPLWNGTGTARLSLDSNWNGVNVVEYDYGQNVYVGSYWFLTAEQSNSAQFRVEYWTGSAWNGIITSRGNYDGAGGTTPFTARYLRISQTLFTFSGPTSATLTKFKFGDSNAVFPP